MNIKRSLHSILLFVVAVVAMSIFVATTTSAIDQCTGNNTYICKSSPEDLTGGILKNVINVLLYIAGTIAVIVMIVGGIRYITSDGDPNKASQARNTVIYALVGIVIAVMSFSIVNFVVGRI